MSKMACSSLTGNRMIALSTHSRLCSKYGALEPKKLPLACPSHHPVSKEVASLVGNYSRPSYRRKFEVAIQRLTSMHEGVGRAGRILQRKNWIKMTLFTSPSLRLTPIPSLNPIQDQMMNRARVVSKG